MTTKGQKNEKPNLMGCVAMVALLTGCGMSNAGIEGALINDALPPGAILLKADFPDRNATTIAAGTEAEFSADFEWNSYKEPVPCSAIKEVQLWTGGPADGEMGLMLVNHKYGGKYYPYPPTNRYWIAPVLWLEKWVGKNQKAITMDEAEAIAAHCGVNFKTRR